MAHDAFISYASEDKPIADAVCAGLEAMTIRCWIAPRDILPGQDWSESLVQAINASRVLVLVFSDRSNRSPHVKREVERAVHNGTAVIPFRVDNVEPTAGLSYFLGTTHWLDAVTPPIARHIDHLADVVGRLTRPADLPAGPSPGHVPSRPKSILWVNDKPSEGAAEIAELTAAGIKVARAASTTETMQLLISGRVTADAVVSDMGRLEEGEYRAQAGLLLIKLLRKGHFNMPVIVYASPKYQGRNHSLVVEAGGTAAVSSKEDLLRLLNV